MQPFAPDTSRELRTALGAIAAQGESERYWRINRYEAAFDGLDVDGRPSFWDTSAPLRERAPAIRAQLPRVAARRLTALLFADRAFPKVRVCDSAYARTLSDEDRKRLDALVQEILRVAKMPSVMRATTMAALRSGTAVAITGIRRGLPVVDFLPAKCCAPTFDADGCLTRVEYVQKVPAPGGRWMLHRRVIDATKDVQYQPVDVAELKEGTDLDALPVASVRALSFLPVLWIRNQPDPAVREIDGYPVHHGLLAEIDAADMECSQLYRTAIYNGEPVMARIGGNADAPQTPLGPEGRIAAPTQAEQQHGGAAWGMVLPSFVRNAFSAIRGGGAIKKAPGVIWNVPQGGDVKLLESSGAGATIIQGSLATHTRVVTDAMGVILAQPSELGGNALSAKALSILFAPMLATADELRVTYGDALVEIINQLLRWCCVTAQGVYLSALADARGALAMLSAPVEGGARDWMGAPMELAWGEYFEPTWQDIRDAVGVAKDATGGAPVLAPERALRIIAPVLGIEDIEDAAADLTTSREGDAAAMRDTLATLHGEVAPVAADTAVQDTALNGAQVSSMLEVAQAVSAGALPLETAVPIMVRAFQLSPDDARAMLAPAAAMAEGRRAPMTPPAQPAPVDAAPAAE